MPPLSPASPPQLRSPVLMVTLAIVSLTHAGFAEEKPAAATNAESKIAPKALAILERASTYLEQSPFFSVNAEIWQEESLGDGRKLNFTKTVSLHLRRPDRLRVKVRTTEPTRDITYDGKQLTLLDRKENLYGTTEAPPTLDKLVDAVEQKFGFTIPMDDLIVSKPFQVAKEAQQGDYLGKDTVLGETCHHLAFQHEAADWEIWIEEGVRPLPHKVVIHFKGDEEGKTHTVIFTEWDFETKLLDFVFAFDPPADAKKIAVQPLAETDAGVGEKK